MVPQDAQNADESDGDLRASQTRHSRHRLFALSAPAGRTLYAVTGFGLMFLKYSVEALTIWYFTSSLFLPWDFLNPLLSMRMDLVRPAPEWLGWAWFVWSLPFLWIAVVMSVRRAIDAAASPWIGLLVLVPLLNLWLMLMLCIAPGKRHEQHAAIRERHNLIQSDAISATLGIGFSLMIGGIMMFLSVYLLSSYGASLFLGTPLLMGATSAFIFNRSREQTYAASVGVGLASVGFGAVALLLFALEGVICIAMAAPLMLPTGALGGLVGKVVAETSRQSTRGLAAAIATLPLLAYGEVLVARPAEREVMTAVEIRAPIESVWENVIDFPEISTRPPWYFRWGIAAPEDAHIAGRGVGATRYCEFTSGTFVEPITVWDGPHRLGFDVTKQPAPLFELSPYRHIHPPHLDGYLRSKRGEFLLIELPDGRTRLEGRTWYEVEMFPEWYWTLWSNQVIHRIHERVLLHVKQLSETNVPTELGS